MRGRNIKTGTFFKGYYYDLIVNGSQNGKATYEYDTEPQIFEFREDMTLSSTVFTNYKGTRQTSTNIGGVFQTSNQMWRILTYNTEIDFKPNGKIVVYTDEGYNEYFIKGTIRMAGFPNAIQSSRFGKMKLNVCPIAIDLK